MIYVDTSVLLAQLWAEDRTPPSSLWERPLISSRLLEYETWTRIHAKNLAAQYGDAARALLGHVSFLELAGPVLARALEPFSFSVCTLDALHVASLEFLRSQRQPVELASFDTRMLAAAASMGIPLLSM